MKRHEHPNEEMQRQAAIKRQKVTEAYEKILQEEPLAPSARVRYPLPKLLDEVTMMCLAKRPQDRPYDVLEVVRLLQEAV